MRACQWSRMRSGLSRAPYVTIQVGTGASPREPSNLSLQPRLGASLVTDSVRRSARARGKP